MYLPSLKLLGQSILELLVAQGVGDQHDLWPCRLTWILIGIIFSSRTTNLPSLKLLRQTVLELSVAQDVGDQHDLWPTDLNINRDQLLIKDYLPTKFEAPRAKGSRVISCTRLRDTDIHVPTDMCKLYAPPSSRGHKKWTCHISKYTSNNTRYSRNTFGISKSKQSQTDGWCSKWSKCGTLLCWHVAYTCKINLIQLITLCSIVDLGLTIHA